MLPPALAINQRIAPCRRCELPGSPMKGLGCGNPRATLLLVAQNPGLPHPTNLERIPFALQLWGTSKNTAGSRVLEQMMTDVGFTRDDFYVTNIQKCEGLTTPRIVANCEPWLHAELQVLPRVRLIVALGNVPGDRLGVQLMAASFYRGIPATKVAHPAAPLYPGSKLTLAMYRMQWRFVWSLHMQLLAVKGDAWHL
jgi:uracil-DNA glycosylase family 4